MLFLFLEWQCLSVYAQSGDEHAQSLADDLKQLEEEGLKDILLKTLSDPCPLNASQQDFLQSFNGQISVSSPLQGVNTSLQQVLTASNDNMLDSSPSSEQTLSENRETASRDQTPVDSDSSPPQQQQQQPHPQIPPMYPHQMMMPRPHPMMMMPSPSMFYPPAFIPPYPIPPYYPMPPPFGHPMVPQMNANLAPNYNQSADEIGQQEEISEGHVQESPSHNESTESEQETAGTKDEGSETKLLVPGVENPLPPSVLPEMIKNPIVEVMDSAHSHVKEKSPSPNAVVEIQPSSIEVVTPEQKDSLPPPVDVNVRVKSDESAKKPVIAQELNPKPENNLSSSSNPKPENNLSSSSNPKPENNLSSSSNKPGLPCRPGPTASRNSNQNRQDRRNDDRRDTRNTRSSKSRQSSSHSSKSSASGMSSPPPQQQQHKHQHQQKKQQQTVVQQSSDAVPSKEQASASSESSQPTHKPRYRQKGGASAGPSTGGGRTSGPINTSKRSQSQEGTTKPEGIARSYSANRKNSKKTPTSSSASTGGSGRNSKDATRNIFDDFCGNTFLDEPVVSAAPCTSYRSFCGPFTSLLDDSCTSHADNHRLVSEDHLTTIARTTSSQSVNVIVPIPCASGSTSVNDPPPPQRPSLKFETTSLHPKKHSLMPELDTWNWMKSDFNVADHNGPLDLKQQLPAEKAHFAVSPASSSFEESLHDELEFVIWDSDVGDCLSYVSDEAPDVNELRMVVPVSSVPCRDVPSQLVHGQCYVNPTRIIDSSK